MLSGSRELAIASNGTITPVKVFASTDGVVENTTAHYYSRVSRLKKVATL